MIRDKFLYAAIALTLVNLVYWFAFNINSFLVFRLSTETGLATASLYYISHMPGLLHGLQFLAIATHIAPDQLLMVPFFYLFPSPLTLMLAKALMLSLSGLLVFFIARDFTGKPRFALALAFAYFFNPGTIQMQLFEYHVELLLIPFYLLTFYYCMKLKRRQFYISLLLLLGTFESVLSIAACLGLGIIAYEYLYDQKLEQKKARMRLASMILVCTFFALIAYNILYYQLQGTYSSTISLSLIPDPYPFVPLFSSASYSYPSEYVPALESAYALAALEIAIGGFGILAIFVILPALVFMAPWFGGIFLLQNAEFFYAWRYAYVIPGAVLAAMLGYAGCARRISETTIIIVLVVLSLMVMLLQITPLFPDSSISQQILLFHNSPSFIINLNQLRSVISLIPGDASVMTQFNLYPYLSNRQYAELIGNDYYFRPEYILFDSNVSVGLPGVNATLLLSNYLTSNSYRIFARNGSAILWKTS